jgi:hypothetical protein
MTVTKCILYPAPGIAYSTGSMAAMIDSQLHHKYAFDGFNPAFGTAEEVVYFQKFVEEAFLPQVSSRRSTNSL